MGLAYSHYLTWPYWSSVLYEYGCAWCYTSVGDTSTMYTLTITSPSFYKDTLSAKALMLSVANINHVFEHLIICMCLSQRWKYLVHQDQVIMALVFNNNHINWYHMDTWHSIGLGWIYFTSPDYVLSNIGSIPLSSNMTWLTQQSPIPINTQSSLMV